MTSDRGTAKLTTFYGKMTSLEGVLAALTAEGVDIDHLRASDLYERDLDCQNLGAYEMLDVIATAVARVKMTGRFLNGCGIRLLGRGKRG